jgi:hypothetical protein
MICSITSLQGKVLFQFTLIRNCQFLTAFCTAASQHFPAIGCLHALTKTVNSLTAAAMRLECTFHFSLF